MKLNICYCPVNRNCLTTVVSVLLTCTVTCTVRVFINTFNLSVPKLVGRNHYNRIGGKLAGRKTEIRKLVFEIEFLGRS